MSRVLVHAVAAILIGSASAAEAGVDAQMQSVVYSVGRPETGTRSTAMLAHYRRVFLGCVYSYHECEHLGHDRGFFNHYTRHDHYTCHHGPSYACYGR